MSEEPNKNSRALTKNEASYEWVSVSTQIAELGAHMVWVREALVRVEQESAKARDIREEQSRQVAEAIEHVDRAHHAIQNLERRVSEIEPTARMAWRVGTVLLAVVSASTTALVAYFAQLWMEVQ